MQCPHCQQEHPDQVSFCPVTGKPIKSSRTCPNCGREVEVAWIICGYCGKTIDTRTALPVKRSQKTSRSTIPSSSSITLFLGGLGILAGGLIFLALVALIYINSTDASIFNNKILSSDFSVTAISESKKPTHFGAFLIQGSSLVELPELELFGVPRTYDISKREVVNDNQPIVIFWRQIPVWNTFFFIRLQGKTKSATMPPPGRRNT